MKYKYALRKENGIKNLKKLYAFERMMNIIIVLEN